MAPKLIWWISSSAMRMRKVARWRELAPLRPWKIWPKLASNWARKKYRSAIKCWFKLVQRSRNYSKARSHSSKKSSLRKIKSSAQNVIKRSWKSQLEWQIASARTRDSWLMRSVKVSRQRIPSSRGEGKKVTEWASREALRRMRAGVMSQSRDCKPWNLMTVTRMMWRLEMMKHSAWVKFLTLRMVNMGIICTSKYKNSRRSLYTTKLELTSAVSWTRTTRNPCHSTEKAHQKR